MERLGYALWVEGASWLVVRGKRVCRKIIDVVGRRLGGGIVFKVLKYFNRR